MGSFFWQVLDDLKELFIVVKLYFFDLPLLLALFFPDLLFYFFFVDHNEIVDE